MIQTSDTEAGQSEPGGRSETLVALALLIWTLSPFVRLLI